MFDISLASQVRTLKYVLSKIGPLSVPIGLYSAPKKGSYFILKSPLPEHLGSETFITLS